MNTYPNQKIVETTKIHHKDELYTIYDIEVLNNAISNLNNSSLKVWLYLSQNKGGYKFALSSKDCCEKCNITHNTYDKAIHDLMDKGYLVNKKGNFYKFYEEPKGQ